jgi:hypothetical protein
LLLRACLLASSGVCLASITLATAYRTHVEGERGGRARIL